MCYIKYGWHKLLVDPDNGENCCRKLASSCIPGSMSATLFQSVPSAEDKEWTSRLYNVPKITFGTIYDYLVDRKLAIKKVTCLESVPDKRAQAVYNGDRTISVESSACIEYTRTLDKAYRFFQDGHVQHIKYHPLPNVAEHICISAVVLPSMKKDRVYNVTIFVHQFARISHACCSCPAGLSGCCNHITATLYSLEDYVHSGLQDDELKGCTDRLQTWNIPRHLGADPRPTDEIQLSKKQYGVEKRVKKHRVNEWDCRPINRRLVDPNTARNLREALLSIEKIKVANANNAVSAAQTSSQKRKANQNKLLIETYGTSCYLQLLDDEPAPPETHLDEIRKERLSRANAQKKKLLSELGAKLSHVKHDHTYASVRNVGRKDVCDDMNSHCTATLNLVHQVYEAKVVINSNEATKLEIETRKQASSELWRNERKLRITASVMREVCHRKASTSCTAFVQKKINPKVLCTPAVCYGREHENDAISSYIKYQRSRGVVVEVHKCGLVVDKTLSWLAASPDGIVFDPSEKDNKLGCLEVKCPFSCEKKTVLEATRSVSAFCLIEQDGGIFLSKSHGYYYQVQTEMHVTNSKWCDFVVWSPLDQPFIQRIHYDSEFMSNAIAKAQKFYFNQFLPAILPYVILPPSVFSSSKSFAKESPPLQSAPSVAKTGAHIVSRNKLDIGKTKLPVPLAKQSAFAKKEPIFSAQQHMLSSKKPAIPAKQPVLPSKQTMIPVKQLVLPSKQPMVTAKQPVLPSKQPMVPAKQPVLPSKQPMLPAKQPVLPSRQTAQQPVLPCKRTTISAKQNILLSKQSIIPAKQSTLAAKPVEQPFVLANQSVASEQLQTDIQILSSKQISSLSLHSVMQQLHVTKHMIKGDGSCLYHAVAHQAGFISSSCKGDETISLYLRKVAVDTMSKYPSVRSEDGLSELQWIQRKLDIRKPHIWGGDLELRLLAIGLQRDIVVITTATNGCTFARKFPSQPPPIHKMAGGIFVPLNAEMLCNQWKHWKPTPLLLIFNGINHYDSTLQG